MSEQPCVLIVIRFSDDTYTVQRINKEKGMLHFNGDPAKAEGITITGFSVFADGEHWSIGDNPDGNYRLTTV